jgi:hypothetical protein
MGHRDEGDVKSDSPPAPGERELNASMDRSDADAVFGRTVALDEIVAKLRARAEILRAARARPARSA